MLCILDLEAFNEKERQGLTTGHFHLLSLVKVVHFKTLLFGLNNEPLSSELVISNVLTKSRRLESSCFESHWKLEQ